jgi:hypothetical protein
MFFKGIIIDKDGHNEIVIRTKMYPLFITMMIIWECLSVLCFILELIHRIPHFLLFIYFALFGYIIVLVFFNINLALFKKRFKQVFFDLF